MTETLNVMSFFHVVKKYRHALLFVIVLFVALFLRVELAIVNHYANDDHYRVVELMEQKNGDFPTKDECKQCYHPQLYYQIVYHTITFLHKEKLHAYDKERIGQYWNVFFGIGTLILVWLFLRSVRMPYYMRVMIFSLVALNPRFISINIQMTNDSLVIFFATGALYILTRYHQKKTFWTFIVSLLFAVFAAITKSSGVPILFVVLSVLIVIWITEYFHKKISLWYILRNIGIALLISMFAGVYLSPYYAVYKDTGSPFTINREKSPPAHFLKRTRIQEKTGVISLTDAYATFRLKGLLQYPLMSRKEKISAEMLPRTSLWTSLYARWNFIQYEKHPKKWKTKKYPMHNLARGLYVLGLVPLSIFIYGLYCMLKSMLIHLRRRNFSKLLRGQEWIFLFALSVFVLFIMKATYDYRAFVTMKIVYILPSLLIVVAIFGRGMVAILHRLSEMKYGTFLRMLLISLINMLLFLYIIDVLILLKTIQNIT